MSKFRWVCILYSLCNKTENPGGILGFRMGGTITNGGGTHTWHILIITIDPNIG